MIKSTLYEIKCMDVYIRDAEVKDADFLAWAILTAARGNLSKPSIWDLCFPDSEETCLSMLSQLTLAEPESAAHYSGFVIAENEEGHRLGAACGFIPDEKTPEAFTEALLGVLEKNRWSSEAQQKLLACFEIFNRCLPMGHGPEWVLEYIAVKPEARGLGVSQIMLQDLLECGREADAKIAKVAYFKGNDQACKAYTRLGFDFVHELLDSGFEAQYGSAGVAHMQMALDDQE